MFYKAKVAVCSEIRTKHIKAMWAPRRIFSAKSGGSYCNYRDFYLVKYFLILYINLVVETWRFCKIMANLIFNTLVDDYKSINKCDDHQLIS
jgi:hypothetical protein